MDLGVFFSKLNIGVMKQNDTRIWSRRKLTNKVWIPFIYAGDESPGGRSSVEKSQISFTEDFLI